MDARQHTFRLESGQLAVEVCKMRLCEVDLWESSDAGVGAGIARLAVRVTVVEVCGGGDWGRRHFRVVWDCAVGERERESERMKSEGAAREEAVAVALYELLNEDE